MEVIQKLASNVLSMNALQSAIIKFSIGLMLMIPAGILFTTAVFLLPFSVVFGVPAVLVTLYLLGDLVVTLISEKS